MIYVPFNVNKIGGKPRGLAPSVLPGLTLPEVVELVHQLDGSVVDCQASIAIVHDNQAVGRLRDTADAVALLLYIIAELCDVGQDRDDTHRVNQDVVTDCDGARLKIKGQLLGDIDSGQDFLTGLVGVKHHAVGQGDSTAGAKRWDDQLAVVGVDDYRAGRKIIDTTDAVSAEMRLTRKSNNGEHIKFLLS